MTIQFANYNLQFNRQLPNLICFNLKKKSSTSTPPSHLKHTKLKNAYLSCFICSIFSPNSNFFLPISDIYDCSTNFFSMDKLFSNHCQQLEVARYKILAYDIASCGLSALIVNVQYNRDSRLTVYNQHVSDFPLGKVTVHFPPLAQTGSSHFGSILYLKQWKSAPTANLLGWCMLLYILNEDILQEIISRSNK